MNTSALSSISATITGEAVFLEKGSEAEKWCKEAHEANNTFGDQAREEAGLFGGRPPNADSLEANNGNKSSSVIEGNDVRVVIVRVKEGRIADWKGGVKDWKVDDGNEVSAKGTENSRGRQSVVDGGGLPNGAS